ncbi:hypothetical protein Tco_0602509, partial [Tanacetum coccineum]
DLITNNIRNAPYYNAYLEMVAKHDQKIAAEKGGKKKPATAKQLKPKHVKEKSSKPTPEPKPKVTQVKPAKPSPAKHSKMDKVQKIRKGKSSLQLIDEDEPTQHEPEPEPEHQAHVGGVAIREPIAEATQPLPVVKDKGKEIATEEQAAQSLLALHTPKRRSADTDKTNSGGDTKILQISEEQGEDVDNQANLEEKTVELNQGQAGSDPGKTLESRPPPDSDPSKKRRHASDASGSTQPPASQSSAWKTSDTREAPSSSSRKKSAPYSEQPVEDVPIPDDVNVSDSEDTNTAHLPKIKTKPDWLKHVLEEDKPATPEPDWVIPPNELPETKNTWDNALASSNQDPDEYKLLRQTGDMSSFINWFCKRIGKKKLSKADLEGPTFKLILVNPEGHQVVPNVSKPLPLGGPPGDKGRRSALYISKLKAAQYLDFRLEELVLSLWIESEQDYNISVAYGISHWWFKRKEFYITRHSSPSDRSKVRSHLQILSVVSLKTFERYRYTFLKEIVLRRADYKEYKILESDFKNLHPNDFEDLYLLHLQGQLNHLSGVENVHLFNAVNLWIRSIVIRKPVEDLQLGIESYQTKFNLTQPDWDVSDFLFKKDYTIVSKPRALDHMFKDFKLFKFNPGMEKRIWFEDDRRRSKKFMEVIERRLKIRRIFRSLESFVGGRLRDVDYRLIQRALICSPFGL